MTIELTLVLAVLCLTLTAAASFFLCGVQIEVGKDGFRVRIEPRRRR